MFEAILYPELRPYAKIIFSIPFVLIAFYLLTRAYFYWHALIKMRQFEEIADKTGDLLDKTLQGTIDSKDTLKRKFLAAGMREQEIEKYFKDLNLYRWLGVIAGLFMLVTQTGMMRWFMSAFCIAGGLYWCDARLDSLIKDRQARLSRSLPILLDLLIVCLEVGLTIEVAFDKVTMELRTLEPALYDEAQVVLSETQAGISFPVSLQRMANRVQVDNITKFARLVKQAYEVGASVVKTLRDFVKDSEQRRLLDMEKMIKKITSQMMFPMAACFLPSLLIIVVGPLILLLMESMASLPGGMH